MKPLRSLLLSLLVLLQALVPYLHAHPTASSDRVMHLHLAAGSHPGAASAEGSAGAGALVATPDWRDAFAAANTVRAATEWFAVAGDAPCTAQADARAFGMPVEWLRDPPAYASSCPGGAVVRAPPAARPIELRVQPAPAPSAQAFAVLVYAAAAPPLQRRFR
jgi:hypothetical protein